MFWYSCLCFIWAVVVHVVVVILDRPELIFREEHAIFWFLFYMAQSVAMRETFNPLGSGTYKPGWKPAIGPRPNAVRTGRAVLLAAGVNAAFWVALAIRHREFLQMYSMLSALALLSAVYLLAIWSLGPENIFTPHYVIAHTPGNRISFSSEVMRRAGAKRRAIPFDQWITGLLECCELAVKSTSAVRDATDCKDPRVVDCVEFTYEVLSELESRAGVIHHRDKLSQEGHRAIKRFVHSVASISAVSPDPAKWQSIVHDANVVLALRDRLLKGDALDGR